MFSKWLFSLLWAAEDKVNNAYSCCGVTLKPLPQPSIPKEQMNSLPVNSRKLMTLLDASGVPTAYD